jgi:hypothetical protein
VENVIPGTAAFRHVYTPYTGGEITEENVRAGV